MSTAATVRAGEEEPMVLLAFKAGEHAEAERHHQRLRERRGRKGLASMSYNLSMKSESPSPRLPDPKSTGSPTLNEAGREYPFSESDFATEAEFLRADAKRIVAEATAEFDRLENKKA